MKNNLLPITTFGWRYIAYALGALVIFSILDFTLLKLLALGTLVFFIFVFRNPERELPSFEKNSVYAPVDGEVIAIDELDDSEYRYKVTIDSSYTDVGVLRIPMNATVSSVEKKNGTKLSLDTPLAKKLNENVSIVFLNEENNKLKIVHTLKQSVVNIGIDLHKKNNLIQSSRYGFMLNGITEIYIPDNFRLSLILGEETKASESLVGFFS